MSRASKLTSELQEKFCNLVRQGNTYEVCSWSCGIDETTFYRWKLRGECEDSGPHKDFCEAIRKAEGDCEVIALGVINKAAQAGDWRAMAWRLERMKPEKYGQRINVTHEVKQRLANDLINRLREKLDTGTFRQVAQALMDDCADGDVDAIQEH